MPEELHREIIARIHSSLLAPPTKQGRQNLNYQMRRAWYDGTTTLDGLWRVVLANRQRATEKIAAENSVRDGEALRVTPLRLRKRAKEIARQKRHDKYLLIALKRRATFAQRPPVALSLTAENVLRSCYTVNRHAKRARDAAAASYSADAHGLAGHWRRTKERDYDLKDRAIVWLAHQGIIAAEQIVSSLCVYRGSGYCFHSTLRPIDVELSETSDQIEIEARPKSAPELRLCDALATLEALAPEGPTGPEGFMRLERPERYEARSSGSAYSDSEYDEDSDDYSVGCYEDDDEDEYW